MWSNCVGCTTAVLRQPATSGVFIGKGRIDSGPRWVSPFVFTADYYIKGTLYFSDTRVLLTSTENGIVLPLTEKHHADARVEAVRLRRMMGSGLITDSFGEARWMGALENTRRSVSGIIHVRSMLTKDSFSLGDLKYKPFGVTPEPQVRTLILDGSFFSILL